MMHKHVEGAPCAGLETLLQDLASGKARGIRKIYAIAHAAHCSRCGNYLERMKAILHVMKDKKESAPAEAMDRLRAKLREMEHEIGENA